MFHINGIAKLLFDGIDASLRGVCPDAQDIGEICNLDCAHLTFSEQVDGEHHDAPPAAFDCKRMSSMRPILCRSNCR